MKRSGTADLPLHHGRVPAWLSSRMALKGGAITEVIVDEFGPDEFLSRISDPFWFQSFGAVLGMDWHSSGITTSVMGALKKAINPKARQLGLLVCGGRGKYSRQTPSELLEFGMQTGLDGHELARASRLTAKVDNNCLQDGFQIYQHNFIVTPGGKWAVVQQGMNQETAFARRYHWHSPQVQSFVSDPHAAVVGDNRGSLLNLSDKRADEARDSIMSFMGEPMSLQWKEIGSLLAGPSRHLSLPAHHEVRPSDVNAERLGAVLALAHDKGCQSFTDALLLDGVGPRTVQSLALVSEVIYGKPARFDDPARFSFAHGGKDGHPFPVPLKVYDEGINFMKRAVNKCRIDGQVRRESLNALSQISRYIEETMDPRADVEAVIAHERAESWKYGGMTECGGPEEPPKTDQLSLEF
ncbi:MAG: DUF763 domain-containing protein [Spirochaetales bacterium]|nr:DUF763 domain-containing protein [Spirochaetales bacterium]